jgi:hypothetical protein
MPDVKEIDRLQAIRDLLREGRTTEADKQLDSLQEQIRQEEERRKRELPPPSKRTLAELQIDFAHEVTDLLGNPPRLLNLVEEIIGAQPKAEPN